MEAGSVLLVSSEPEAEWYWAGAVVRAGLEVVLVHSAAEALERWEEGGFDLSVLDLRAHEEGLELCRALRALAANPILMLCPHDGEDESVAAYAAGADECIARPVSPRLLVAKIRAWLRHQWTIRTESLVPLEVEGLRLEPACHEARTAAGSPVGLTALEFRLLYLLMAHAGRVLPADWLIPRVWGPAGGGNRRQLRHLVRHLRGKLEAEPRRPRTIHTVRRRGYTFRVAGPGLGGARGNAGAGALACDAGSTVLTAPETATAPDVLRPAKTAIVTGL